MKQHTSNILCALLTIIAVAGCTKHRDLYVNISPLFVVKADWSSSSVCTEEATALVFNNNRAVLSNPYMIPAASTQPQKVAVDTYDILVFNNMMFSSTDNGFTDIFFKGTDRFNTFEAYANTQDNANPLFRSGFQEVFVNNPDLIAAATYRRKTIEDDRDFSMKYEDGILTPCLNGDYINDSVSVKPVCLTRTVQIVIRAKNYKPKFAIYGTLRGMAQGVNLVSRHPTGNNATHAGFRINNATIDSEHSDRHILTSEPFTSFGPWWNEPLGKKTYILDILTRYNGQGNVFSFSFNVTRHIPNVVTQWMEKAIESIKSEEEAHRNNGSYDGPIPRMDIIVIEIWLDLPEVIGSDDGLDVGVDEWGDVTIVDVPIRF